MELFDINRYSAFSSWTPSLATKKVLLRVEIRSGSCNFVIPSETGKSITTKIEFEGLVLKTKKLRVMQNLELRFNKFTVSAGMKEIALLVCTILILFYLQIVFQQRTKQGILLLYCMVKHF